MIEQRYHFFWCHSYRFLNSKFDKYPPFATFQLSKKAPICSWRNQKHSDQIERKILSTKVFMLEFEISHTRTDFCAWKRLKNFGRDVTGNYEFTVWKQTRELVFSIMLFQEVSKRICLFDARIGVQTLTRHQTNVVRCFITPSAPSSWAIPTTGLLHKNA